MAESVPSRTIDPQAQVDAARRHVKNNASTHVVVLQRTYTNRAEEVWSAVADPENLADWFIRPEGDLRTGGRYRLDAMGVEGTLEYIDHVRALQMTWESQGTESLVAVAVTQGEAGTTVTLRHTLPDNEHWKTYGPAATGIGWDGALAALDVYLSGNEGRTRQILSDFDGTPDSRELMRASALAWKQAHVASDVEEAEAEAAASRALSAFTDGQAETLEASSDRRTSDAASTGTSAASTGAGQAGEETSAPNAEPAPGHEPGTDDAAETAEERSDKEAADGSAPHEDGSEQGDSSDTSATGGSHTPA